jgi:hypothetical protein
MSTVGELLRRRTAGMKKRTKETIGLLGSTRGFFLVPVNKLLREYSIAYGLLS